MPEGAEESSGREIKAGRHRLAVEERQTGTTGPEGPRGSEEDDEGLRLVSTRGMKTNARLKAGSV